MFCCKVKPNIYICYMKLRNSRHNSILHIYINILILYLERTVIHIIPSNTYFNLIRNSFLKQTMAHIMKITFLVLLLIRIVELELHRIFYNFSNFQWIKKSKITFSSSIL